MPRHIDSRSVALVVACTLAAAACTDRDPVAPKSDLRPDAALAGVYVGSIPRGGSNYTMVDVGNMHSCYVSASSYSSFTSGDCWGSAQQYNPSDPYNLTLLQGANFPGRPQAVTVGLEHSCAIDLFNNAWCWGRDHRGQLGGGGTYSFAGYPTLVVGNHLFSTISAGGTHSCGVDLAGAAWCWGDNTFGQLGNGTQGGTSSTPVQVAGYSFQSVSAGQWHSCGITTGGALLCWGRGREGQLGIDTLPSKACVPAMTMFVTYTVECAPSPVQVRPGTQYSMASAGFTHSCAVTTVGSAFCWGTNAKGELGDGYLTGIPVSTNRLGPVPVYGTLTFANVSAGLDYTCGVTTAGRGYCWGNNSSGQVGNNSGPIPAAGDHRRAPQAVMTTYTFASISAGSNHTCGVTPWGYYGNTLLCWGSNYYGQLGDGTWDTRTTPVVSRGY